MFGHTQIVLISLVVETLLIVGVLFKIFIVFQILFNVMLYNAMFKAMLKKEKSVLEILYTVEIKYWSWKTIYICIYTQGRC